MKETEELLVAALHDAVSGVEPDPDALARLRRRLARRPHLRRWALSAAAVVVVAIVVGVAVLHHAGSRPIRVTNVEVPPLPPTAERIAAVHDAGGTRRRLHIIDARDGAVVRDLPLSVPGTDLALVGFTPGKHAVLVRTLEHWIWTVDTETGRAALLLDGVRTAAFSPDGKALAYVRDGSDGPGDLVVRDLASGVEHRLRFRSPTQPAVEFDDLVWRPDSHALALVRGYYGFDTYIVDPASDADLTARPPAIPQFAAMAWVGDTIYGDYYCCGEAQPPVPASYRGGVRSLLDPYPAHAGSIALNAGDGRRLVLLTGPRGGAPSTLLVGGHRLDGYEMAIW